MTKFVFNGGHFENSNAGISANVNIQIPHVITFPKWYRCANLP